MDELRFEFREAKKRFLQLYDFISQYKNISDSHSVDFFTDKLWEKLIPEDWKNDLLSHSSDQPLYPDRLSSDGSQSPVRFKLDSKTKSPLKDFLCTVRDLRLFPIQLFVHDSKESSHYDPNCIDCYGMSQKKVHEVHMMSEYIKSLVLPLGIKQVIDIGSGKGYLSQYLSFCHRFHVVGIDSQLIATNSAMERCRKVEKYYKHSKKEANLKNNQIISYPSDESIFQEPLRHTLEPTTDYLSESAESSASNNINGQTTDCTLFINCLREPITDFPNKVITDSLNEPIPDSPNEPITDCPNEPITDSLNEPITDSPNEPITDSPNEPITGYLNEPITDSPNEPITDSPNKPIIDSPNEPKANSRNQLITGSFEETNSHATITGCSVKPITESSVRPFTDCFFELVTNDTIDSITDYTVAPATDCSGKLITQNDSVKCSDVHYHNTVSHSLVQSFKPVTHCLGLNDDVIKIAGSNFNSCYFTAIVGLHTCGDLAGLIIKQFVQQKELKVLCVVGCCYHHITEKNEATDSTLVGFPMSECLKECGAVLGRNLRMLACQNQSGITSNNSYQSVFYRAILQVILQKEMKLIKSQKDLREFRVGRIKKYNGFNDYIRKALIKLGIPLESHPSNHIIEKYYHQYEPHLIKIRLYLQIKAVLAPLIESLILLDKIMFLLEHKDICDIKDAWLCQLFHPSISPRCVAICAIKETK